MLFQRLDNKLLTFSFCGETVGLAQQFHRFGLLREQDIDFDFLIVTSPGHLPLQIGVNDGGSSSCEVKTEGNDTKQQLLHNQAILMVDDDSGDFGYRVFFFQDANIKAIGQTCNIYDCANISLGAEIGKYVTDCLGICHESTQNFSNGCER